MTRLALMFTLPVLGVAVTAAAAAQAAPSQTQARAATAQPTTACTPQQAMEAEQRQDFDGAIRVYTCLSKADPRDWRPVASIAGVYGMLNRPTDEAAWAHRAIALAPQQPGPYINLGNAEAEQNHVDAARAAFEKAMNVAPSSSVGAYSLGVLAESQHNAQDAEQWYRKALAVQPKDENAAVSLAALLGNTGRVAQAIPILQQVLASNPQAQDAREMLNAMQGNGQQPQSAPGAAPIERR